jgi:hypothetical protein
MRLKSRLWIEAQLRRWQQLGNFGAVIDKGADEAGAVYIYINHLNGTFDLLIPPPGPSHDEAGERHFTQAFAKPVTWDEARSFVAKQKKFDGDLWSVEFEDRAGVAGLKVASLKNDANVPKF